MARRPTEHDENPVQLKEGKNGNWTVVYADQGEALDDDNDFVYGEGETTVEALQEAVNCIKDLAYCLKTVVESEREKHPHLFVGRFAGLQ